MACSAAVSGAAASRVGATPGGGGEGKGEAEHGGAQSRGRLAVMASIRRFWGRADSSG
jgi:hypothetical protein